MYCLEMLFSYRELKLLSLNVDIKLAFFYMLGNTYYLLNSVKSKYTYKRLIFYKYLYVYCIINIKDQKNYY